MIMKPQLAICIDSGSLTTLEEGKEYILRQVSMGSDYYYVSYRQIKSDKAHFGILRGSYFKILGPLDHLALDTPQDEQYVQMSLF